MVKLLGGELKVKSKLGEGSEFYFFIPVHVGKEIDKTEILDYNDISLSGNILLVEDNKTNQLLMDENMPNMSGMEATQKILEIEKENSLNHTPVIALTANALKGDKEMFLKAGMAEYLAKPVDKNQLISVLKLILKKIT